MSDDNIVALMAFDLGSPDFLIDAKTLATGYGGNMEAWVAELIESDGVAGIAQNPQGRFLGINPRYTAEQITAAGRRVTGRIHDEEQRLFAVAALEFLLAELEQGEQ